MAQNEKKKMLELLTLHKGEKAERSQVKEKKRTKKD